MLFSTEALQTNLDTDITQFLEWNDVDEVTKFALKQLQTHLLRKFTDGAISKLAEKAAQEKFLAVNQKVSEWTMPAVSTEEYQDIMRAKSLFRNQMLDQDQFPLLSLTKAFNVGMSGPGASVDATSDLFIEKHFNGPLSCTNPTLYKLYYGAIANHRTWRKAEKVRSLMFPKLSLVRGNKLFFVPKETIIARTAATEPTLNMFGQKGYGDLLEVLLRNHHGIDIPTQEPVNRWFARSGSLNGEYATIDLSSASDTIGVTLCKELLPERIFGHLMFLRSPVSMVGRKAVPLHMISTMGNGFTFPLQTLIFANLVLSVMIRLKEPVFDIYGKRRYAVYGDDIICPTRVYDQVVKTLHSAGFTVNLKKSFSVGKFRESCGGDYFSGKNVRAVYLHKCSDDSHVYSLINRLMDWCVAHCVTLPSTFAYLKSLVAFRPIPLYEDEGSGIRTPQKYLTNRKVSPNGNLFYRPVVMVERKYKVEDCWLEKLYHGFKVSLIHGSFKRGRLQPRILPGCETYKVIRKEATTWWDFVPDARITTEERISAFERNISL